MAKRTPAKKATTKAPANAKPAAKAKKPAKAASRSSADASAAASGGSPRPLLSARDLVAALKRLSTKAGREGMIRFGIAGETADTAFGIPVGDIRDLAKDLRGPNRGRTDADRLALHVLAQQLWATGQYESRILAAFIDEPSLVTVAQMDQWAADFRDWAICDTACFHLFDKPPLCDPPGRIAFGRVKAWAARDEEFVRRGAFALLACLALHDKKTDDAYFATFLPLIEKHATDPRNFVKKGVNWALRAMGKRGRPLINQAIDTAQRLGDSEDSTARWVGKDALRELKRR